MTEDIELPDWVQLIMQAMAASQVALHPLFEMNEDDELTMRSELCDQKKLKEYGQYEAYQKLMESFKARDQPVEI